MALADDKQKKRIVVIMPFVETPTRSQSDLTEFFQTDLKDTIEAAPHLKHQYVVGRSDDTFDITAQIIRDLYTADIVICDLSGPQANPNVMYELGMRLALTSKPVILIRETLPDNRRIFDIGGFHTFEYSPHQYRLLGEHIMAKLAKFEDGTESYESPVLRVLKTEPVVVREINRRRTRNILVRMRAEIDGMRRMISVATIVFLQKQGTNVSFDTLDDILDYLRTNHKSLSELPWESFVFSPNTMPAITAFLVDLPLDGLMPDDMTRQVNRHVSEFFDCFLGYQFTWREPILILVYQFAGECKLMTILLEACYALLGEPDPVDREHILGVMSRTLARSGLTPDNMVPINPSDAPEPDTVGQEEEISNKSMESDK